MTTEREERGGARLEPEAEGAVDGSIARARVDRRRAWFRLGAGWLVLTGVVLVVGVLLVRLGDRGGVVAWDAALRLQHLGRLRREGLGGLTPFAALVSLTGTQQFAVVATIGLCAVLRRRGVALWLVPGVAYAGAAAAAAVAKVVTQRPGPPHRGVPGRLAWWDTAFPSGHATTVSAIAMSLVLVLTTGAAGAASARWHVALRCTAVAWVVLVCVSRIVLDVHWVSDVLAGWVLGALWAWLVHRELSREPLPGQRDPLRLRRSSAASTGR